MKVNLVLYASLARLVPERSTGIPFEVEVPEGATIRDVLAQIGVPDDSPTILFINGIHARLDQKLTEGARVAAFPPIAGG